MISKGEYFYPDIAELLPKLEDAFVAYYGNEFRPYIHEKLQNLDIIFYTGVDSVFSYTNEKIFGVKDK